MNFWGFFLQWQIHKSWNGRSLLDGDALHWRWKGASSSELATNAILSQGKQWLVSLIQYPGLGHTGMDLLQGYGKLSGSSGQLYFHYFFLFISMATCILTECFSVLRLLHWRASSFG